MLIAHKQAFAAAHASSAWLVTDPSADPATAQLVGGDALDPVGAAANAPDPALYCPDYWKMPLQGCGSDKQKATQGLDVQRLVSASHGELARRLRQGRWGGGGGRGGGGPGGA